LNTGCNSQPSAYHVLPVQIAILPDLQFLTNHPPGLVYPQLRSPNPCLHAATSAST
jgi:hypothetical protein